MSGNRKRNFHSILNPAGRKHGGGTSQGARVDGPWTWTTAWGWTVGAGAGWAEEGKGEKWGQL